MTPVGDQQHHLRRRRKSSVQSSGVRVSSIASRCVPTTPKRVCDSAGARIPSATSCSLFAGAVIADSVIAAVLVGKWFAALRLSAAGRRYQASDAGKTAHRRRQRTYRQRQTESRVTHQGTHSTTCPEPPRTRSLYECVICGRFSRWHNPFDPLPRQRFPLPRARRRADAQKSTFSEGANMCPPRCDVVVCFSAEWAIVFPVSRLWGYPVCDRRLAEPRSVFLFLTSNKSIQ